MESLDIQELNHTGKRCFSTCFELVSSWFQVFCIAIIINLASTVNPTSTSHKLEVDDICMTCHPHSKCPPMIMLWIPLVIRSFHATYSLLSLFHTMRLTHYFHCFIFIISLWLELCLEGCARQHTAWLSLFTMQLVGNTMTSSQPRCTQPFIYNYYLNPRTE